MRGALFFAKEGIRGSQSIAEEIRSLGLVHTQACLSKLEAFLE